MSFDMFSNNQSDDMDPNYIYPRPYLDPMMYFNPYAMNGVTPNQNMSMANYMTYMNPYMANPMLGQDPIDNNYQVEEYDVDDMDGYDEMDDMYTMNGTMQGMPNMNMQGMPPGMMMPGMMPNMPPGMMQGMMMPGMNMMMPGMMPGMPMYPFMPMMPGMEPINVEEFDEEEM